MKSDLFTSLNRIHMHVQPSSTPPITSPIVVYVESFLALFSLFFILFYPYPYPYPLSDPYLVKVALVSATSISIAFFIDTSNMNAKHMVKAHPSSDDVDPASSSPSPSYRLTLHSASTLTGVAVPLLAALAFHQCASATAKRDPTAAVLLRTGPTAWFPSCIEVTVACALVFLGHARSEFRNMKRMMHAVSLEMGVAVVIVAVLGFQGAEVVQVQEMMEVAARRIPAVLAVLILALRGYSLLLYTTLFVWKRCFTASEAAIISNLLLALVLKAASFIIYVWSHRSPGAHPFLRLYSFIDLSLYAAAVALTLLIQIVFPITNYIHASKVSHQSIPFRIYAVWTCAFVICILLIPYSWLFIVSSKEPLSEIIRILFHQPDRWFQAPIAACLYWLTILLLTALFPPQRLKMQKIIIRKAYHAVALAIFTPAIFFQPDFLRLSSILVLALMIVVELVRILRIHPLWTHIDKYCSQVIDDRDTGDFILTHLYLLFGCVMPLWFPAAAAAAPTASTTTHDTTTHHHPVLLAASGLAVLGVGDSVASIVGTLYGSRHWPGTRRTIEGSLAGLLSTASFLLVIHAAATRMAGQISARGAQPYNSDYKDTWRTIMTLSAWPTTLAIILEAFTYQIDNLVLPIFFLTVLQVTCLKL